MTTARRRFALTCAILAMAFAGFGASAQDAASPQRAMPQAESESGPFVIRSAEFDITGITIEFLLRDKADIKLGKSFPDRQSLEAYIADRRQVLLNERVLASVESSYEASPAIGGGYDVAVRFKTVDSWHIIALPYFKYDSNTGLQLSMKGRDYNFLGSMQKLSLDLNYKVDEDGRQGFGLSTGFTLPFWALNHEWSFGLDDSFALYPDSTPTTSATTASLSVVFRELGFPITLSASQGLNFNPDGDNDDPDPYYLTESASMGADIPTFLALGGLGTVYYDPSLSYTYNWRVNAPLLYDNRQGSTLSATNKLLVGRVDWHGNQRSGFKTSVSNTSSYYFTDSVFTSYMDLYAEAHANWKERLGVSTQVNAFYRLTGDERTSQGVNLRGIYDDRVDCEDAVIANFDFPVKLFDFPTHLLIKKNWLDFELQASPFIDAAITKGAGTAISSDKLWCSGGLEFLVFPVVMRSFIVRASAGFDLKNVLETRSLTAETPDGYRPYELFFGIGMLY